MERDPTTLEHALLGLLADHPRTGYAVRQVFAATPMASLGDSPGTIYPALKRLEAGGLIKASKAKDGRGTRELASTRKGKTALHRWLKRAVTASDVVWLDSELLLRYEFLELLGDDKATTAFLTGYRDATAQLVETSTARRKAAASSHAKSVAAHDVAVYKAKSRWAAKTLG